MTADAAQGRQSSALCHWLYVVANLQTGGGDRLLLAHVRALRGTRHRVSILSLQSFTWGGSFAGEMEADGARVLELSPGNLRLWLWACAALAPAVAAYAFGKGALGADTLATRRGIAERISRFLYGTLARRRLGQVLARNGYVGIHVFHAAAAVAVRRTLPALRTIKLYTEITSPAGYGVWTDDVSVILPQFDRVVVPSPVIGEMIREKAAGPVAVTVVPFTIDAVAACRSPNDETPRYGIVSRLSAEKGIGDLVRAAVIVRDAIPGAKLVIAGSGPDREMLEQAVAELGLNGHVIFLGRFERIEDVLSNLDVFVLPSLTEGMPLSILEAMSAGLPVVASRVGAVPDLVEDGATGYLVPPGDPAALADRIIELLRGRERRQRMGECGRTVYEERYSFEIFRRNTVELYDSVLKGSATP